MYLSLGAPGLMYNVCDAACTYMYCVTVRERDMYRRIISVGKVVFNINKAAN